MQGGHGPMKPGLVGRLGPGSAFFSAAFGRPMRYALRGCALGETAGASPSARPVSSRPHEQCLGGIPLVSQTVLVVCASFESRGEGRNLAY
eukprot:3470680-Prymnesium_polylepis.1